MAERANASSTAVDATRRRRRRIRFIASEAAQDMPGMGDVQQPSFTPHRSAGVERKSRRYRATPTRVSLLAFGAFGLAFVAAVGLSVVLIIRGLNG